MKLNLGCGKDIKPKDDGWVNIDVVPLDGVDVVWDITKFPYPFKDDAFDYVYTRHVLEHIPHRVNGNCRDGLVLVMEELYRILKDGGIVKVIVPAPNYDKLWNPTHCRLIYPSTFLYFSGKNKDSYYTSAIFDIIDNKVTDYSFSIFNGRVTEYHLKKYLKIKKFGKPKEIEILLKKKMDVKT